MKKQKEQIYPPIHFQFKTDSIQGIDFYELRTPLPPNRHTQKKERKIFIESLKDFIDGYSFRVKENGISQAYPYNGIKDATILICDHYGKDYVHNPNLLRDSDNIANNDVIGILQKWLVRGSFNNHIHTVFTAEVLEDCETESYTTFKIIPRLLPIQFNYHSTNSLPDNWIIKNGIIATRIIVPRSGEFDYEKVERYSQYLRENIAEIYQSSDLNFPYSESTVIFTINENYNSGAQKIHSHNALTKSFLDTLKKGIIGDDTAVSTTTIYTSVANERDYKIPTMVIYPFKLTESNIFKILKGEKDNETNN